MLSSPEMTAIFDRFHRTLAFLGTPLMPLMPASVIIPEGALPALRKSAHCSRHSLCSWQLFGSSYLQVPLQSRQPWATTPRAPLQR